MKVLVIGAHGKVGKLIVKKMKNAPNYEPTAFIRKKEQQALYEEQRIPCVVGSLENPVDSLTQQITGFDAVVFSAGSGASTADDKTLEVDLYGAVKAMTAAEKNGVERFVMVSAAFADEPGRWAATGIRPYYIAKHFADRELRRSSLDYTIVRPTLLTDEQGKGKITVTGDPKELENEIPRADVADTVLEVLQLDSSVGKVLEISKGDTSIREALSSFLE